MGLSIDQSSCLDSIIDWWSSQSQDLLTLGGYAGCGKTTMVKTIREKLPKAIRIAFVAFTGKASSVLRSKLFNIRENDYCGTIHSLIYEPIIDVRTKEVIGWNLKRDLDFDLIIIDEASMINEDLYEDLKSFSIPILAVGDHGQLPPVSGTLNLMENPILRLEKIHRYCENDVLIELSAKVRDGYNIPYGIFSDKVMKVPNKHIEVSKFVDNMKEDVSSSIMLCAFNRTRNHINKRFRDRCSRKKEFPEHGEQVICLRNNKKANIPIYNGVLGRIKMCDDRFDHLKLRVQIDESIRPYKGPVSKLGFANPNSSYEKNEFILQYDVTERRKKRIYLDYFDFGYCLTVHKSQGSEWKNVMVIEQYCKAWDYYRWLYTAITRTSDRLLLVA